MLQLIQEQPDMRLVGHVQGNVELLLAVTTGVDVLILGASQVDPPPGIISHLLSEFPHLRILVIATTGGRACLFWLGLRHRRVDPATPAMLLNTVRRAYTLNPTM
jgi:hypothetical protein